MGSPARSMVRKPAPRGRTRNGTGASGPVRKALGADLVASLERLCGPPTIGRSDVCLDVASIAVAAAVGHLIGHLVGPLLAVCYIGVRQRHLSNLAHECVHSKLMATRRENRIIGYLLTGLLGEGFQPYRSSHLMHHARLGSDDDPMFRSYRAGNINVAGVTPSRRTFVIRIIVRGALWRLPKTAALTLVTKSPDESWRAPAARSALWAGIVVACLPFNAVLSFLLYWLVPLLFVRPVVTWITDLGNHAGLIENADPLRQTRGWSSHWLTRHLLGGHLDDMYHPLHHWCPQIPWRRLPEAKASAAQSLERWGEVPWCSGYFFRRRSTPDQPCVIEDIIRCLSANSTEVGTGISEAAVLPLHYPESLPTGW
ncbi:Fatty acid desaturase [Parafrankia irregularis]|uniref:Fatty acid desaturase n=1 Tax=Parafrankia irregularis TaxID=795642 RepID=A0A0S4R095_9ACTN|nr:MULTISPECIES: fatty acid desaturase [Frankiaceae]MBE3204757.1 fatty acid desaturase [Parafrankia sp. CH37]CUU60916.1 Fatty acid desaturase [Parafrankia irregularis]